jgi:hypothetical protein
LGITSQARSEKPRSAVKSFSFYFVSTVEISAMNPRPGRLERFWRCGRITSLNRQHHSAGYWLRSLNGKRDSQVDRVPHTASQRSRAGHGGAALGKAAMTWVGPGFPYTSGLPSAKPQTQTDPNQTGNPAFSTCLAGMYVHVCKRHPWSSITSGFPGIRILELRVSLRRTARVTGRQNMRT